MPIVVDGVMYVTAPDAVYALVPETGELLWKHDPAPIALRGLAYWKGAGGLAALQHLYDSEISRFGTGSQKPIAKGAD